MTHRGQLRLYVGMGAFFAVALGIGVAGCSGVVPLGEGAGDGGAKQNDAASDAFGFPWGDGGATPDDAGFVWGDAGIPEGFDGGPDFGDASFFEDAPYSDDAFPPTDAGFFYDAPDDVAFGDSAVCTLRISSASGAEAPAACDACMGASCCVQNYVCGTDPDCVNIINCEKACEVDGGSSSICASSCTQFYPAGASDYVGLLQCMSASCNLPACSPLF